MGKASSRKNLRVLDANDWVLLQLFGACFEDPVRAVDKLVLATHSKYGIPVSVLNQRRANDASGKGQRSNQPADPVAFGESDTPAGDINRVPVEGESFLPDSDEPGTDEPKEQPGVYKGFGVFKPNAHESVGRPEKKRPESPQGVPQTFELVPRGDK